MDWFYFRRKSMQTLSMKATTLALITLAVAAYVVCAVFRPIFPAWPMYNVTLWQVLFPGFAWTWGGVLIGLVWMVAYAVFAGVVFVGAYNFFASRQALTERQ